VSAASFSFWRISLTYLLPCAKTPKTGDLHSFDLRLLWRRGNLNGNVSPAFCPANLKAPKRQFLPSHVIVFLDLLTSQIVWFKKMASKDKPLPLSETLRDLTLLRASDGDVLLSSLLPTSESSQKQLNADGGTGTFPPGSSATDIDRSVDRSFEFVREARAVLHASERGDSGKDGDDDVNKLRRQLEDVLRALRKS